MSQEFKEHLARGLEQASEYYLADLEAMSQDQLARKPGGQARSALDYTFEVLTVNNRLANSLAGVANGPWPFGDGWAECPKELADKAAMMAAFKSSTDGVRAAFDKIDPGSLATPVTINGNETSKARMATLAAVHMMYHCGQLNLIQAMDGDEEVHWA